MKQKLNKWQLGIRLGKVPWSISQYHFQIYFLKFIKFPEEGKVINKENYKGFNYIKYFYLPSLICRTHHFKITFPIKIKFY